MVSEKQLRANRENAKKGGVKTIEGKLRVRFNALKHGLLSQKVMEILPPDEKSIINWLREQLVRHFCPKSVIEFMLIENVITCYWRLQKAIELEVILRQRLLTGGLLADVLASESDLNPLPDPRTSKKGSILSEYYPQTEQCQLLQRYRISAENSFYRSLHELERIKMSQQGYEIASPTVIDVSIDKDKS